VWIFAACLRPVVKDKSNVIAERVLVVLMGPGRATVEGKTRFLETLFPLRTRPGGVFCLLICRSVTAWLVLMMPGYDLYTNTSRPQGLCSFTCAALGRHGPGLKGPRGGGGRSGYYYYHY